MSGVGGEGGGGGGEGEGDPYKCRNKILKLSRSIYQNETSLSSGS